MARDSSDTLHHVMEKIRKDLADSMVTVSDFRKDEDDRLSVIRSELTKTRSELEQVISEMDEMTSLYFSARGVLSQSVRGGTEMEQRRAYEKAEEFLFRKAALAEREKGLRQLRDYLERDERRVASRVEKSDSAVGRLRVALNVVSDRIETIEVNEEKGGARRLAQAYSLVERESMSLARELHDGPAQKFSGALMSMDFVRRLLRKDQVDKASEELDKVREQMVETMDEIRSFLHLLYPRDLEDGLMVALDRWVEATSSRYGVSVKLKTMGPVEDIPGGMAPHLYKIVRQAVANAVTKGEPKRVTVLFSVRDDILFVKIMDDGFGFDVETAREEAKERGSYGMVSMEERSRILGGEFNVDSVPGQGTIVSLKVPIRSDI
ncbi:sensor histidine kinase [Dethiosulfovibrio sp. F2B]|uniref:sensor histidine kinase n=1 Tax=Dethiosulfovibrio faecalis TaxID=2720018 RepID=UPI001F1E5DA5|nr:sensor histidine kinase [Dethiosulfovibrio faecalis]MCF4152398.1 sensor histidine kinase [Dethiosulfovibrio faecalis]